MLKKLLSNEIWGVGVMDGNETKHYFDTKSMDLLFLDCQFLLRNACLFA